MIDMAKDLTIRYDGTNEKEIFEYFKKTYGLSLDADAAHCFSAFISPEEVDFISRHVTQIFNDYLVDVIDKDNETVIKFRSRDEISIEAGSWFINCTGYIVPEVPTVEPYLSPQKTVVSFQLTSTIGIHVSNAYHLIHLWYLDKLFNLPIYDLNIAKLVRQNKQAYLLIAITHAIYNQLILMNNVPLKVIRNAGGNFDDWYPFYRQLFSFLRLMLHKKIPKSPS